MNFAELTFSALKPTSVASALSFTVLNFPASSFLDSSAAKVAPEASSIIDESADPFNWRTAECFFCDYARGADVRSIFVVNNDVGVVDKNIHVFSLNELKTSFKPK